MSSSLVRKLLFVSLGLFALFFLVNAGTANEGKNPGVSAKQETNSLKNQIISTKDRKLQIFRRGMPPDSTVSIAVRNLDNERWLRDLEIEVQNKFKQPIYYLEVLLRFPDLINTELDNVERRLVIPLSYGRHKLWKLTELATPEDVPINPGEKVVLKVPEENWKGVEYFLTNKNIPQSVIKNITLRVTIINFGDGTGMEMGEFKGVNRRSGNDLIQPRIITAVLGRTDVKKTKYSKR